MIFGQLLRNRLLADATIASIVGTRVYPGTTGADQPAVLPYIVYHMVGGSSLESLTGPSGLGMPRVQVECWVDNWDTDTLETLADRVRVALQTYQDINAGFQHASAIGFGDIGTDIDSKELGRFVEFELFIAQAVS